MAKRSSVTGAKAINAAFKQVVPGLTVPINQASRAALKPLLAAAKRNLKANGNVQSGQLLKSLTVKKRAGKSIRVHEHLVGPASANPHYRLAHLIEFGTAPHMIGEKLHPGARAFPFLRPAFEETQAEVIERFGAEIGPAVEKRAAYLARKTGKK
jgi:HK97 gp10 family phage protein